MELSRELSDACHGHGTCNFLINHSLVDSQHIRAHWPRPFSGGQVEVPRAKGNDFPLRFPVHGSVAILLEFLHLIGPQYITVDLSAHGNSELHLLASTGFEGVAFQLRQT